MAEARPALIALNADRQCAPAESGTASGLKYPMPMQFPGTIEALATSEQAISAWRASAFSP